MINFAKEFVRFRVQPAKLLATNLGELQKLKADTPADAVLPLWRGSGAVVIVQMLGGGFAGEGRRLAGFPYRNLPGHSDVVLQVKRANKLCGGPYV